MCISGGVRALDGVWLRTGYSAVLSCGWAGCNVMVAYFVGCWLLAGCV